MDNLKLGEILETEAYRDAIHIAVAPVIAAEKLSPGEHVGVVEGEAASSDSPIGIVDPFLKKPVRKGQRFYLFLYPNTITSLRHEWMHPAFSGPHSPCAEELSDALQTTQAAAKERMEVVAQRLGFTYDRLMNVADDMSCGEYSMQDESIRDEWYEIDREQFWRDYSSLTGESIDPSSAGGFTCSC